MDYKIFLKQYNYIQTCEHMAQDYTFKSVSIINH